MGELRRCARRLRGISAFLANPPKTLKSRSMPGDSDGGFLKFKSEYIVVAMNDKPPVK